MNQIINLLMTLYWIFTLVECIRNEYGNNRLIWLATLVFLFFISGSFPLPFADFWIYPLPFAGAIAYFLVRRLPSRIANGRSA